MCGAELETASPEFEDASRAEQDAIEERVAETSAVSGGEELPSPEATKAAVVDGGVMESVLEERQSRIVFWMTSAVFLITVIIGTLIVQNSGPVQLAIVPTSTPIPPTPSFTPSVTLPPTETSPPTDVPTETPPPADTATPEPPRVHNVTEGETLFGLSLFYNVGMDAIAEMNGLTVDMPIQSGQTLQIPAPTATPPLEPISFEINGEPVIADPTNCERYQIQEGDALSLIAARYSINFDLLLEVNRLTDQSILQPGDTVCIPEIIHGGIMPPTPGPSPTPSATSFPEGPTLLYPANGTVVQMEDEPVVLQWVAVKDIAPEEWYMVELIDRSIEGARPHRGFTRENAFQLPHTWRPTVEEEHEFGWRVSIVHVTGQREDGGFIYTFGGRSSQEGHFVWAGAIPTPTPTPTATAMPEP